MAAGVVTYRYPAAVAGGTVAPTAAQMIGASTVIADVSFNAGDTVVNMVHNMGLNATGVDGTPRASVTTIASGTALNTVVIAVVDANTVSVTPVLGAANTGGTWRVQLQRGSLATG